VRELLAATPRLRGLDVMTSVDAVRIAELAPPSLRALALRFDRHTADSEAELEVLARLPFAGQLEELALRRGRFRQSLAALGRFPRLRALDLGGSLLADPVRAGTGLLLPELRALRVDGRRDHLWLLPLAPQLELLELIGGTATIDVAGYVRAAAPQLLRSMASEAESSRPAWRDASVLLTG
jgi:hypothetical protein